MTPCVRNISIETQKSYEEARDREAKEFLKRNQKRDDLSTEYVEGLPRCTFCGHVTNAEGSRGRDTETIGGYEVEYYHCPHCETHLEIIDNEMSQAAEPEYEDDN